MKLSVVRIDDRGVRGKERVVIKVLADTNLTHYLLLVTSYEGPDEISTDIRQSFWFPSKKVAVGDFVRVYSGKGEPFRSRNKIGTTTHRIFWGLSEAVWGRPEDCAVLIEIADWDTSPASP